MNDSKNPLSPHLQIYRWQISSLLSITHRITGILNLLGLIFISAWISSAGIGENLFEYFSVFLKSFIGKFILIGFTWSISYHLLSGIRHFFWDLGYGYKYFRSYSYRQFSIADCFLVVNWKGINLDESIT